MNEALSGSNSMSTQISMLRLFVKVGIWFAVTFALLFGAAGTLRWPEAWIYILMQFSFSTAATLWLKKHDPALLRDRMKFMKRSAKAWDKAIILLMTAFFIPLSILPGLDAVRYQWSHVPLPLKAIGFAGLLVASGLIFWVMKENSYLSRIVEVQKDRGHKVVTTGPYQYVRHPMYVGAIVWLFCIPLALGSWTTFIPATILVGLVVVRTLLEERTLHQELAGYTAYARTVKYRLVPGIW